jgi:Protein of unknown function (DUF2946)
MRWFRDNVRHGSWLALVAIAINLALSFGHVHVAGGHCSEPSLIVAALGGSDHGKGPGHSNDPQADDHCPICIASSAIANAMAASPPALPLQLTATVVDRTIPPVRLAVAPPRAAFQSRGPPVS